MAAKKSVTPSSLQQYWQQQRSYSEVERRDALFCAAGTPWATVTLGLRRRSRRARAQLLAEQSKGARGTNPEAAGGRPHAQPRWPHAPPSAHLTAAAHAWVRYLKCDIGRWGTPCSRASPGRSRHRRDRRGLCVPAVQALAYLQAGKKQILEASLVRAGARDGDACCARGRIGAGGQTARREANVARRAQAQAAVPSSVDPHRHGSARRRGFFVRRRLQHQTAVGWRRRFRGTVGRWRCRHHQQTVGGGDLAKLTPPSCRSRPCSS